MHPPSTLFGTGGLPKSFGSEVQGPSSASEPTLPGSVRGTPIADWACVVPPGFLPPMRSPNPKAQLPPLERVQMDLLHGDAILPPDLGGDPSLLTELNPDTSFFCLFE